MAFIVHRFDNRFLTASAHEIIVSGSWRALDLANQI